jgi:hypothetical protein
MPRQGGEIALDRQLMLKRELRRQLNSARASAAKKRIADAYVSGGAENESARPYFPSV